MRFRKLKGLLLVPVAVLLMAAGPLLVDPAPIPVPAGLSATQVEQAVRVGVSKRGWLVTKQEQGYAEATLNIRVHTAKIGITYDTQSVQIKYLDSTNLDYEVKKDGPHIHANYLKWINNTARDISLQLQTATATPQG
jgi:hypothetical protein